MMNLLRRLVREEDGQGLVEYGLIIAIISLIIVAAGPSIANAIQTLFEEIGDELNP